MPHIPLTDPIPGIRGLTSFKPESGSRLMELAQQLLCADSPLTRGERELIASYVSARNQCRYCYGVHSWAAAITGETGIGLVESVVADPKTAAVDDRMRALLHIAGKVQTDAHTVSSEDVEAARAAGADDEAIHDTVLIAAAFCMYNRYVDGLAAIVPEDPAVYERHGRHVADRGYVR